MTTIRRTQAKVLSAVAGGAAVIALGVLAATVHTAPATGLTVVSGGMSTGETETMTTPDTALATKKAVPPVKATQFGE